MTHQQAQLWDWSAWHCSVHHTTLPRSLAGGCGGGGVRQQRRRGILCELLLSVRVSTSQGVSGARQSFMGVGVHPRDSERESRAQKTFTIPSHFLQNVVTVRVKVQSLGESPSHPRHPEATLQVLVEPCCLPGSDGANQSHLSGLLPRGPQTIGDII